ncbi:putative polysaccharide biosynthesis protein [Halalkalibacter urbisdiaboli]|uniref:putative polysaccharide biosynthesis protein n=1 Tax=Halalkalibacter urbisdiaboli TaxID=1960589 RepID=UPI000B431216|nr:polysaccharide biosynthesis protein [Halalkalibacter urbisdiaboli]
MSTFLKGALWITIATFLSKLLGSFFRIPLQNIAGNEVLGIFSVVYPVYMTILTVTVAGIPLAISKLISEARAHGRHDEVAIIFRTASMLGIIFGVVSFALMYGFADFISAQLGGTYAKPSIIVVSFTLIAAPYMAVYRGFFQGFEDMVPTALSQVIEQFVRVILIVVAAIYFTRKAFSYDIVAGGVMIGSIIGVLFSLVYLRTVFSRRKLLAKQRPTYNWTLFKQWSKRILLVSLPICFGALTMALLNVVDSFTIPRQLVSLGSSEREVTDLYGIYGRGQALVQIAVVFASALILPLIPAITKALAINDQTKASDIINRANLFTHLTSWPAAVGLVVLTYPLNFVLFGDYLGSDVLAVMSASSLFTAFSVLTTGMLQGANRETAAAIIVLVSSALKIVLNILLVAEYGIMGAAISTLVIYMLVTLLNVIVLYRTIPFRLIQREHIVFIGSSAVMGGVLYLPVVIMLVNEWSRLSSLLMVGFSIGVGGLIYFALVVVLKGLDRSMLQSLPLVSKLIKKHTKQHG